MILTYYYAIKKKHNGSKMYNKNVKKLLIITYRDHIVNVCHKN